MKETFFVYCMTWVWWHQAIKDNMKPIVGAYCSPSQTPSRWGLVSSRVSGRSFFTINVTVLPAVPSVRRWDRRRETDVREWHWWTDGAGSVLQDHGLKIATDTKSWWILSSFRRERERRGNRTGRKREKEIRRMWKSLCFEWREDINYWNTMKLRVARGSGRHVWGWRELCREWARDYPWSQHWSVY